MVLSIVLSRHVFMYASMFCFMLALHVILQQLYFGYCRSSLLNIFFHGSGMYCQSLRTMIDILESSYVNNAKTLFIPSAWQSLLTNHLKNYSMQV